MCESRAKRARLLRSPTPIPLCAQALFANLTAKWDANGSRLAALLERQDVEEAVHDAAIR